MKKIILASLLMAGLAVTANAQKGSVLLYGNVGLGTSKAEPSDIKQTNFSLNPGIGYQFNNNWTIGVAGGISTGKSESGTIANKYNSFVAGPFLRYTKTLSPTFFFFSQLDAQYSSSTSKPALSAETKYTGFTVGITPAIGAKVYKGMALNFSLGSIAYSTQKLKGSPNKNSGFSVGFGNQANMGVSVNL